MSTKIYTGFSYTASKPSKIFHEFLELSADFRKYVQEETYKEIRILIANYIVNRIDKISCGLEEVEKEGKPYGGSPYWEGFQFVQDQVKKSAVSYEKGLCDYDLSLAVLPIKRRLIGIFFGANKYFKKFMDYPQIRDYHYQNQSDCPDDITYKEWHKRAKDWEEVVGSDIVSERGFVVEIIPKNVNIYPAVYDSKEMFDELFQKETIESRAKNLAVKQYMQIHGTTWMSKREIDELDLSEQQKVFAEKLLPINFEFAIKKYENIFGYGMPCYFSA